MFTLFHSTIPESLLCHGCGCWCHGTGEGMEVAQFLDIWGDWEQVDQGWSWGSGEVKTGVGKVNQGQQERSVERRGAGRQAVGQERVHKCMTSAARGAGRKPYKVK